MRTYQNILASDKGKPNLIPLFACQACKDDIERLYDTVNSNKI
jgi:hypothetical protein